jgi:hypothetical protein
MLNLYLTQKAAADLKVKIDRSILPATPHPACSWLVHIFLVDRAKYYIFINQASLFSVVLEKKAVKNIWQDFRSKVAHWMCELHVQPDKASAYLQNFEQITIFKAANKKLLGHLNDIRYQAQYLIYEIVHQQKMKIDFAEIRINEIPHVTMAETHADRAFIKLINES